MNRLSVYLVAVVMIQASSYAEVTKLAPEHRKALQNSGSFRDVHTTTNLPPAVVALCADDKGRLADPGQKWEATDLITDASLPRKRLIWAVAGDQCYYVVHYERGGRAHSFHVLVATRKKGETKVTVIWRGIGSQLKDFKAFLAALEGNQLDDTRDSAY